MKTKSAREVMLCWTPGTDRVALVPWPDNQGISDAWQRTGLACYPGYKTATPEQLKAACFMEAVHLIVRDGCDPQAVHRALLGVTEYVDGCSDDMPGVAALRRHLQRHP